MKITEFFSSDRKEHWLGEIKKSGWAAGDLLYRLLSENKAKELLGESTKVFLLNDGENLVSFCTLSETDDIRPTELTPWIGFVFTFPEYRGHHMAQMLIGTVEWRAYEAGYDRVYISTDHTGLYEKYGYEFYGFGKTVTGEESRIYTKKTVHDEIHPDIARNKQYYISEKAEPCDCAYCKNYCGKIRAAYPRIAGYLDSIGVDIEKPLELIFSEDDLNRTVCYYGCQYVVFGTCDDKFHIAIDGISFIKNIDCHPNTDIEEEHFVLDFGEIILDMEEE